ncbi:SPOR domain-containing protein [Maridesulfovibrio sp. FT414]|uniref:SPOR domain-containing protein n=1 Tax=Maridesulfovibrio sp. FT414 TaxID=2979469 RepID=UPI003D8016FD
MAAPKGKKTKADNQEKTYTFTFTVPEMIGICAGSVAALCAFFVLGILLGRGYQPEKDVPELAMMMPSQSGSGSGEIKGGVLKPEELDYIDQLKKKPESAVRQEENKEQPSKQPEKTETAKVESKPVVTTESKPEAAVAAKITQAEPEPPVEIDKPQPNVGPIYNYVYQAASFGDTTRAQEFSDKLSSSGLNAYVEAGKSGSRTWYRVFVRHTGTPDSTEGMKKTLRQFGIKKPLLKSKVPVS